MQASLIRRLEELHIGHMILFTCSEHPYLHVTLISEWYSEPEDPDIEVVNCHVWHLSIVLHPPVDREDLHRPKVNN